MAINARYAVNRPIANIFAEPSLMAEVTSQGIYGSPLDVLTDYAEWLFIRTPDGYRGYVQSGDVIAVEDRQEGSRVRVAQLSANLYRTPDVKTHAPLLNVPWEAELRVLDDSAKATASSGWLRVCLLDGTVAYVQRGDVTAVRSPRPMEEALLLARRFMGITYTWGGTSSYGLDCSGFVQMLFRQHGITIPRDAQAQSDWSGFNAIEREQLKAGDVIFFGATPHEITHVGVYLGVTAEGPDSFIHATTEEHPGVQISQLDQLPWLERRCTQRRLKP